MGITDSRTVLARIESQYKSIRKYYDPVYGEITVLQNKASKQYYALIEKTFLKENTNFQQFLAELHTDNYLLKPQHHYVCDLSLCSDIRLYFFFFPYTPRTLEQQRTQRMQQNKPFTKQQSIALLIQQIEIIQQVKSQINPETNKNNKIIISNNNFLYSPKLELRTIEPVFKNQPETVDDFDKTYLSPETYSMVINGENYRAKENSNKETSIVFVLACNFLELLLLADLSAILEEVLQSMNLNKLYEICQQVGERYGPELKQILIHMLDKDDWKRPSLAQTKRLLKNLKKNRKSIIRYQKQKTYSTEVA